MGKDTPLGGWRIGLTMGSRITQLKPVQGFCAETGGAITLFLATALGVPVSTTHTITGAIIGVGAARRAAAVRWHVAQRIVIAWVLTLPAAGLLPPPRSRQSGTSEAAQRVQRKNARYSFVQLAPRPLKTFHRLARRLGALHAIPGAGAAASLNVFEGSVHAYLEKHGRLPFRQADLFQRLEFRQQGNLLSIDHRTPLGKFPVVAAQRLDRCHHGRSGMDFRRQPDGERKQDCMTSGHCITSTIDVKPERVVQGPPPSLF
jgi:hypothetical protein